jgi:methylthioribose-1-phosphate isomerase
MGSDEAFENVCLNDDGTAVVILDQSLLPNETKFIELRKADEMYGAIVALRVRGAPAIGIFAAFALYVVSRGIRAESYEAFLAKVMEFSAYLCSARPTAVNLSKQLRRMERLVISLAGFPVSQILDAMKSEAVQIRNDDAGMCRAISEHGFALIRDGSGILTHCNAGPLATSRYGTGLGAILLAHERGVRLSVYCDETRPLMQGARLTMYELSRAGVDCTLICDNMAGIVMKEGRVGAVFVGCDRVARNGDVANKIGTSGVAILAKHYSIPFYVFCPSSSIDRDCETGAEIEIEQRPPSEITRMFFDKPIAPPNVKCYNPAFDVTDGSLVTAIITENGIHRAPYCFDERDGF